MAVCLGAGKRWTSDGKVIRRSAAVRGIGYKLLTNSSTPDCGLGRPWPSPDWEKHEAQALALVGPDAALWTTSPRLASALAASIPSGRPEFVRLRTELRHALFGEGLLPFVLAERAGDPTVVVHHGILDAPPPLFEC